MKKQFQSKSVPQGTRTIWRYLGALFLLFTFAIGQMWAATENNPTDAANNTEVSGTSYSISGSLVAGSANQSSGMDRKGVKIRTNQSIDEKSNVIKFTVKSGYKITAIDLKGTANGSNAFTIGSYSIDAGTATTKSVEFPNKNGTAVSYSISGFNATSAVYFYVSAGSGEQFRMQYTVTYEETSTGPVDPTITFNNGNYTVDGADLDLSTLFTSNSSGAVTYTVKTDGGTGASISGTTFTATAAGTATVTASQAEVSGTYNAKAVDATITVAAAGTCTPPDAPENLGVVVKTNNYAKFSWDGGSAGANGYSIALTSSSGAGTFDWADYGPAVFEVSGLTPETEYTFKVKYYAAGKACASDEVTTTFTTYAACANLVPATSGDAPAAGDAISMATAVGGSMTALTTNISYTAYGLLFASSSSTKAQVTLNHLMQVGTVISATLWSNNTGSARTLKLNNSGGTTKATWSFTPASSSGEEKVFTYVVVAGDGLAGSNVFQLQRGSDVYLKSITVSNCGAALYTLSSAIDPVAAEGKATITLSKTQVAAGATATATYSAIDAAYDFDEWVISGATIDNAKANPVTITMGSTDATITLKLKAASVKYDVHFDSKGGSAVDDQLVEAGGHATVPTAPTKFKYTFGGWSETDGGSTPADLSAIAINAEKTFYAIWTPKACPTSGTIFSVSQNGSKPGSEIKWTNADNEGVRDVSDYFDVVNGIAALVNNSSSNNQVSITTDPKMKFSNDANGWAHLRLECALAEGDTIRLDNSNKCIVSYTADKSAGTADTLPNSSSHTIIVPASWDGEDELYIFRKGSNFYISSISIVRPAKYDVTFNLHGHGTPIAPQSILDGGKVTKPSDPSESGWDFDGWYATYVADPESYDDAWDFANDVVSDDIELHAKWTAHAASTDATLSALSVAGCTLNETFAPATTAYTINLPFYGTMPVVGDVTATKNDENAKTPVVSISGNVITIHCEAESGATLDYTITVSTDPTPAASSSVNIEQEILDHSKSWGYAAALSAANITIVDADALDSIDESKDYRNEPFLGLKFKKATSKITIIAPASTELNVKFGSINSGAGLKVSVNGSTPAAPSLTDNVYTLAASAGVKEVVFTLDVASKTVVLKQIMVGEAIEAVTLPWKVSFNVGGHADAVNPMVWTGTALTLPGVTNVATGYTFENWNDGSADYLEGADYTPTANVTLNAVYSMAVEDRLAELEFNGVAVAGFSPDITIYNMTVPYSVALPQITKAVAIDEAGGATATIQATVWDDVYKYYVAQAYVIPAGGTSVDAKFYQVRFTMDPKLGANIFTAELTSPTAATYSGLYADAENSKIALANDGGKYKFSGTSNYITIALKDGAFAEGDLLKMTYSADPTQGKLALYPSLSSIDSIVSADFPAANLTLPAGSDAYNVLHIRRTSKNNYNGWVSKVEVLREMDPIITSLKVGDDVATINEGAKTIALELPQSADITAIVPNIVAYANGGATVTPSAAQDFTSGPINYTVTSLYGETTTYAVSITKAAASSDATLSALTVNGQAVALVDGVYAYDVELPYGTTAVPTVVATAHHAGAVATVDPCTLSGATITVVPESGVGDQQVYTLTFTISPWKEIVIWDGSNMTSVATSPEAETGMAWAATGFGSIGSYNTTYGEKAYTKYLPSQGAATSRYMTLTVPAGYVAKFYIVMATHNDGTERGMFIGSNLVKNPDATSVLELSNNDRDVAVAGMSEIVGAGTWYINPNASIDFQEIRAYLRKGYVRSAMLGAGVYGTICVDHNVAVEDIQGATMYELMGREPEYGKLAFDEIVSGELEAGAPYVFQAHGDKLILFYGDTKVDDPVDKGNGMYGTFVDQTLTELNDIYYFAQRALWSCSDLTSLSLPANRAYVKLSEVDYLSDPNPAPGRRRVTMAVNGEKIATGCENLNVSDKPVKMIIDGQMYILRGEKMYDVTGKLVK